MEQKVSWRNFLTETGLESINCIKTVCTVRKYHIMILDHAQFVMSKMLILLKQLSWGKKSNIWPQTHKTIHYISQNTGLSQTSVYWIIHKDLSVPTLCLLYRLPIACSTTKYGAFLKNMFIKEAYRTVDRLKHEGVTQELNWFDQAIADRLNCSHSAHQFWRVTFDSN